MCQFQLQSTECGWVNTFCKKHLDSCLTGRAVYQKLETVSYFEEEYWLQVIQSTSHIICKTDNKYILKQLEFFLLLLNKKSTTFAQSVLLKGECLRNQSTFPCLKNFCAEPMCHSCPVFLSCQAN